MRTRKDRANSFTSMIGRCGLYTFIVSIVITLNHWCEVCLHQQFNFNFVSFLLVGHKYTVPTKSFKIPLFFNQIRNTYRFHWWPGELLGPWPGSLGRCQSSIVHTPHRSDPRADPPTVSKGQNQISWWKSKIHGLQHNLF